MIWWNKKSPIPKLRMKFCTAHRLVIFQILEDCYFLPYLPKQSLKQLVSAEGNSKHGWK